MREKRGGDHYHIRKHEWFTCVYGEAIVLLTSKEGTDKCYRMSSLDPCVVYAAANTAHALINCSEELAVIVSYGSKQHDLDDDDTHRKVAYQNYLFRKSSS